MRKYMEKYGQPLLDNGYNFVPIIPAHSKHKSAGKAPAFKHWQRSEARQELLDSWLPKYSSHGVGIITRFNPAVDIDCTVEDVTEMMIDFVTDLVGAAPQRVGFAPKTLLLYQTDDPFTKVKSHVWVDEFGDRHAVEILGSGQQFVAFGTHPKTKKPYKWVSDDSPLNCNSEIDLNSLSLEQARKIATQFDRIAREKGWEPDPKYSAINGDDEFDSWGGLQTEDDDSIDGDDLKVKWDGTVDELAAIFQDLPPEESYDSWFPILAALKDAENEPDEFRDIAYEWSSRALNFDDEGFNDKWDNGNFNRLVGQVSTIQSIVRRVYRLRDEKTVIEVIMPQFEDCVTMIDWNAAANRLSETAVFGVTRDTAVEAAVEAYKRINKVKKVPKSATAALAYDFSRFDPPEWVEPWVFNSEDGTFVNRHSFTAVKPYAFNIIHARKLRDIGLSKKADAFVSEDYPIPVINGLVYFPAAHGSMPYNTRVAPPGIDDPDMFYLDGNVYLNTFDPKSLPEMPETLTKSDRRAISAVLNFFEVQFPDAKERRYVMDFVAWVINNPTRKMNYALIIIGCEGSGKTILKKFMTYLLGGRKNVGSISNTVLQKSFTSWASGNILKVIEEISVPSHRYDVVNLLKEPISNETLQVEGKHKDANEIFNTASYMGYSNDTGAIPIGDESRRYLVVQSRFETRDQVLAYSRKHPRFFKNFEHAFIRSAGAIRKWFMDWEYSADFNAEGHAPDDTVGKRVMREINKDALAESLDDAVLSGDIVGVTGEVIHAIGLKTLLSNAGIKLGPTTARRLSELGYFMPSSDRVRVRLNGVLGSVYVKEPEKWIKNINGVDVVDSLAISAHLNAHAETVDSIDEDDL